MTFFEKFFRPFFRPKNSEKFQKNEKFSKIAKNGPNFKNEKCPKSFRNWVKPILGTKKWYFSRNFFSPIFQTKKLEKISKKWKIWKIAKNDPNRSEIGKTQFWALKSDIFREIFFRPFFRPKNSENFQKNEKFEKLPKMTQIVQKLGETNFGH